MIARLEEQNTYNISRLIKAPAGGGPDPTGRHYRDARTLLDQWISDGALIQDLAPGCYPYSQTYTIGSTPLTRNGFIALGDLRDTSLFTHEEVHAHVRDDRTQLRLATAADFGLIFMIYSDPALSIDRLLRDCETGSPIIVSEQPDGSIHRLYRCASATFTRRVAEQMAGFDCVIADGHHRTSAAIEAFKKTGDERWAYAMMAFFNAESPGMTVLPIHRAIRRKGNWNFDEFLDSLADDFEVQDIPMAGANATEVALHLETLILQHQRKDRVAFGLIGPNPETVYFVEAPHKIPDHWPWPDGTHEITKQLATAIFETGILRAVLAHTDSTIAEGEELDFMKDATRIVESVRNGNHQLGFIMPATPLASIFGVARQRQNLPQKSTFFFPKLLTGLIVNRIETNPPE